MYVYIYIYIYISPYTYMYISMNKHMYMYMYMYTCMCMCLYVTLHMTSGTKVIKSPQHTNRTCLTCPICAYITLSNEGHIMFCFGQVSTLGLCSG